MYSLVNIRISNTSINAIKKFIYDERIFKNWSQKTTTGNCIPTKTLKLNADISADALQNIFDLLTASTLVDNMKLADIKPVFKTL